MSFLMAVPQAARETQYNLFSCSPSPIRAVTDVTEKIETLRNILAELSDEDPAVLALEGQLEDDGEND